jgi:type VI secretion system secreted protein VgrG
MPATQIDRPFRIKTPLGDDALLLDRFDGYERLSEPFRFVLRLLSPDPNIDMQALLTKPAVVSFNLSEESERHVHGHIRNIKLLEYGEDGMAAYEAEIVPWLWFLHYFSDCRIFQNKTVPNIIEQVFKDRGFSDYHLKLQGSFPQREYVVQYRETDFNFVSRLLEDEGIFYYFEQSQDKHTLVLANDKSATLPCPNKQQARYLAATGSNQPEDTVISLETEFRMHTGTASLADYDFEKPGTSLFATLAGNLRGEDYDYPGKYKTKDDGARYARIRLEEREVALNTVRGASNCMGFECGYKFALTEHFRDSANTAYTLTALEHHARNASYRGGHQDPFEYANRFEAIPSSVPYRPPRLSRKPAIHGSQTALVVGKAGEEIWTDKYGRVKVQFFWDRQGTYDENSSCWIRVAQGWAGRRWGAIHIPRIGQEVVVSFLEGDPDRPIIAGSVYNADHMAPYALPDEQTKSALKSMSSKGGGGFNELRFEDKKGSEQIFLHGEKDIDIRIKNERREWIGRDRHLIVARDKLEQVKRDSQLNIVRDRIQKIGRDHHLEIAGKAAVRISGSNSLSVTGDVIEEFGGNHSCQVSQDLYLKAMQIVIEAAMGITLKVGANFITIDQSGIAIKGLPMVQINSGGAALSASAGSLVSPLSPVDPDRADDAVPGSATSAHAGTQTSPAGMSSPAVDPALRKSDAPTHNPDSPDNRAKKHWIEIELVNEDGDAVPGERYRITLPDGTTVADGTLDDKGWARVDHIDPGTCQVTFPNLDREAWEPK